jgi:hypothetical protein
MVCRMGAGVVILTGLAYAQGYPPPQSQLETNMSYEKVFFFSGEVRLDDASPPPEPVAIYRVCNGLSRFETSTDSKGHFGFQVNAGSNDTMQSDASQNTAAPRASRSPSPPGVRI